MSAPPGGRLYNLIPAVHRMRDAGRDQALRALLALIEGQYDAIEQDIAGLYENWFIETCSEWVVPYIGDLLGVRPLYPAGPATYSQRAYVANTLSYRRRKGTAAMLEQLAADVTGWPASVVEFFQLLATTQYLNHLRPQNVIAPDLRDTNALELLGGAFETAAHTVDVRHIANGRGRYNIPNVGIYLWRLEDYRIGPIAADPATKQVDAAKPARQGDARAAANPPDGRFTFDPLGIDAPLFNSPQTKTEAGQRTREINVPCPLRRRPLYDELEAVRQASVDGHPAPDPVYFGDNPILQVFANGTEIPFSQMVVCDLGDVSPTDWRRPAPAKHYIPTGTTGPAVALPIAVAVDPVRGRISFPAGVLPATVEVGYTYGFSGDVVAGYDRTAYLTDSATSPGPLRNGARWQAAVSKALPADGILIFATLSAAAQAWNTVGPGADGVIVITDSRSDAGSVNIDIAESSRLLIVAADWPDLRSAGGPASKDLDPNGYRPHLLGDILVTGTAPNGSPSPGQLFIDGLLVEGSIMVQPGNLGAVDLSHTTLAPPGGLRVLSVVGGQNDALAVSLNRSICGSVGMEGPAPTLKMTDCIIGSGPLQRDVWPVIIAPATTVTIESCTVFGDAAGQIIEASNSIFAGVVNAQRRQVGCVRFCSLAPASHTARRFRCQPDLALTGVVGSSARAAVRARVTPLFTTIEFGQPAFSQLGRLCAAEITTGADDESEMGVFRFLQQPQRRANLRVALDEYLRYGLEAGSIEVT